MIMQTFFLQKNHFFGMNKSFEALSLNGTIASRPLQVHDKTYVARAVVPSRNFSQHPTLAKITRHACQGLVITS